MKSKATGCGSISTVFSSILLLCVSSTIIIGVMSRPAFVAPAFTEYRHSMIYAH